MAKKKIVAEVADPAEVAIVSELDAVKTMTMDELVSKYNKLSATPMEGEFASLIKGRNAVKKLMGVSFQHPRSPKAGIGKFAKEMLLDGQTNAQVLAAVKDQFPEAKTTMGCIGYYRAKLVFEGKLEAAPRKAKAAEPADDLQAAA